MEELWRLVLPESPDMLHGFGGKPETMTNLKELLRSQTIEALGVRESDRSWACDALDKALNPQQTKFHLCSTAHRIPIKSLAEGWEDERDKPHALCCETLCTAIEPDSLYRGHQVTDLISQLNRFHASGNRIPDLADPSDKASDKVRDNQEVWAGLTVSGTSNTQSAVLLTNGPRTTPRPVDWPWLIE